MTTKTMSLDQFMQNVKQPYRYPELYLEIFNQISWILAKLERRGKNE